MRLYYAVKDNHYLDVNGDLSPHKEDTFFSVSAQSVFRLSEGHPRSDSLWVEVTI